LNFDLLGDFAGRAFYIDLFHDVIEGAPHQALRNADRNDRDAHVNALREGDAREVGVDHLVAERIPLHFPYQAGHAPVPDHQVDDALPAPEPAHELLAPDGDRLVGFLVTVDVGRDRIAAAQVFARAAAPRRPPAGRKFRNP